MPSVPIPFDVVYMIFHRLDQLDQGGTLRSCSQVCRQWHAECQQILGSRSAILPLGDETRDTGPYLVKWHGRLLPTPAQPSYIVRLLIWEGKFLNYPWLTTTLASLPRLRYLSIRVVFGFPAFHTESPLAPFEHSLYQLELCRFLATCPPHEWVCAFIKCFPKAKYVFLDRLQPDMFNESFHANCEIAPRAIAVGSHFSGGFSSWFHVLSSPRPSQTLRYLRLTFRRFRHVTCSVHCVELFKNLKHLETIDFNFCQQKQTEYWPLHAIPDQCGFIQQELAPVLSTTIHTFRLHPSCKPQPIPPALPVYIALLKAMPTTLRHVEFYVDTEPRGTNKHFDIASFAEGLARFPHLETVDVVFDERDVEADGGEATAQYRAFLEDRLPDLAARGVLRLMSEVRISSSWSTKFKQSWLFPQSLRNDRHADKRRTVRVRRVSESK